MAPTLADVELSEHAAAIPPARHLRGDSFARIAARHGLSISRVHQIASDSASIRAHLGASFDLDLFQASISARKIKPAKARADALLRLVRAKHSERLAPDPAKPANSALLDAIRFAQANAELRHLLERELATPNCRQLLVRVRGRR